MWLILILISFEFHFQEVITLESKHSTIVQAKQVIIVAIIVTIVITIILAVVIAIIRLIEPKVKKQFNSFDWFKNIPAEVMKERNWVKDVWDIHSCYEVEELLLQTCSMEKDYCKELVDEEA